MQSHEAASTSMRQAFVPRASADNHPNLAHTSPSFPSPSGKFGACPTMAVLLGQHASLLGQWRAALQ